MIISKAKGISGQLSNERLFIKMSGGYKKEGDNFIRLLKQKQ
jgi:hypothetical protein